MKYVNIKEMVDDMDLVADFLVEEGRFVGDMVHVPISHLASCIRAALPAPPVLDGEVV